MGVFCRTKQKSPHATALRLKFRSRAALTSAGLNSVRRPSFRYGIKPCASSLRNVRRLIPPVFCGNIASIHVWASTYPSKSILFGFNFHVSGGKPAQVRRHKKRQACIACLQISKQIFIEKTVAYYLLKTVLDLWSRLKPDLA